MKIGDFVRLWAIMVTVIYTMIVLVMVYGWGLWPKRWWVVILGYVLIGAVSQWPNVAIYRKRSEDK